MVLTGQPNVGKSSLFNLLCEQDRAIVTNIPGTTRDVVSVDLQFDGVPIRLLDTAGIRDNAEHVEQEGITRAQSAVETADIVIKMFDAIALQADHVFEEKSITTIQVVNKSDLLEHDMSLPAHVVYMSAKTEQGVEQLREQIQLALHIQPSDQQAPFSARVRHIHALERCLKHIEQADEQLLAEAPLELTAEELRLSQQTLSEITGEFTPDDLLDYVFREFCIGK